MSAFAPGPSDLALPPDIPAVLIPLSDSAAHSSKLTENEPRLAKFSSTAALGRLASSLIKLKDKSSPETASMKLEPTAETSQYTLGSDKTSYIFLQTIDEDECWVNLKHCRIIPDPDEDCVVLQNTSTSMFTARNPEKTQVTFEILPTRHKTLHCGCWQLNLGAGLDFLLLVFRRPSRCLTGALTPSEKWTLRQQQVRKEKNDQTPQETPPPEDKGKALPSEDNEPLRIIATTCLTKVVKVMHHERVTALKICRNPELIEAADIWENEREILSRLKHVCVAHRTISLYVRSF